MASELAVADARELPNLPLLPRVQGIRSSIFDLKLNGEHLAAQVGGDLLDGTLRRKMSGATELKLEVEDVGGKLLRSGLLEDGYDLELDGLDFRFVGWEQPSLDDPITLTHEALVAARLRELHGPHKAYRDEITRARFLYQRVMELKPPRPRFVCPELDKIQPIRTEREGRQAAEDAKQRRGKGIGEVKLTVKGKDATSAQVAIGDRALRVAESEDADTRVMISLILALIVESGFGGYAPNYLGLESFIPIDPHDLEGSVRGYLLGYDSSSEGAIEYFNKHPDAKAYEITQAVQASGAGKASNGHDNYGPWTDEAAEWVAAYGGGADVTEVLRYPFEEKKNENHWKLGSRLGGQVNWRWFESAGWVYFIAEPTLFKSHQRMTITRQTPGLIDIAAKGDVGKPTEEATVEIWASAWAAPPGSVVLLKGRGPADGAWLVDEIEAPLAERETICTVQLKRPSKPRKEPPPPTRTRSVGGSSSDAAPADAPPQVGKMIARMEELEGTPYEWAGGHGGFSADPSGLDCSGAVSDVLHEGGYLSTPEATGALESFGEAGKGKWFTVWVTNAGVGHTFIEVLTTDGWKQWEEGGDRGHDAGWTERSTAGFVARHPKGL